MRKRGSSGRRDQVLPDLSLQPLASFEWPMSQIPISTLLPCSWVGLQMLGSQEEEDKRNKGTVYMSVPGLLPSWFHDSAAGLPLPSALTYPSITRDVLCDKDPFLCFDQALRYLQCGYWFVANVY